MMNERIFQCTGSEEIEELLEMIASSSADTIFLQFPRNSILFHQKTNLQRLHFLADQQKKNLIMVTQNARARKEIQTIGIQTIATIADKHTQMMVKNAEKPNLPNLSKISTHPIDPEKFREKRIDSNPSEIIQKISKPSLHALFLLSVIAVSFFSFVVYLAIPSAQISITPQRTETEMHLNTEMLSKDVFSESDLWKSTNGIFMIPIETEYEYKGIYTDIFKEVEGENAKGLIEIINQTKESILLKEGTRVQTPEGILFLLPTWIRLDAGQKKTIRVTAAKEDVYRKVQADRANIKKGLILTFPGLSLTTQKQIYAVSVEDFSGGRGTWKYSVSQKNIDDAKKLWEMEAKKMIEQEIKKKQESLSHQYPNDTLRLITPFDSYVAIETKGYSFEGGETELLGKSVHSFMGSVSVKVRVYAYLESNMQEIISSKFERLAPDGMKLLSINTDILVLHIQSINDKKNKMKVAVSTRGIYEYVVEPRSEKSAQFIAAAKEAIIGKNKEEAKTILLNNFKEVSDVDISLFPFWKTKLPSLPEKISFTILQ